MSYRPFGNSFHVVHGLRKHPLYSVWANMKNRCHNKNARRYADWGGRGIVVCDEWRNDFKAFYDWSIANGYEKGLTIDRINNDRNYEPTNCRWVSVQEQNKNKRNIKLITFNGKSQLLREWAEELNMKESTLWDRLYNLNWPPEQAFNIEER